MRPPQSVAVVGAGMAGLVAARTLAQQGVTVTLLESAPDVGGQVSGVEVAPGLRLDVGAEALHLGAPGMQELVEDAGLGGGATAPAPVSAASGTSRLLTSRGLRPLPEGVGPAGPTRLGPVLRSGVLGPLALARAGMEPLVARRSAPLPAGEDVAVGEFVAGRFGRGVADAFVDPLLGTLHAGDVGRLSLRACAPMLLPAATSGTSLLRRRRTPAPGLSFVTWPGGLSTLTDALAVGPVSLRLRTRSLVTDIGREADGAYAVVTGAGALRVDAVVLAVPPGAAGPLLRPLAPTAARVLAEIETVDVATVLVALPRSLGGRLPGTGLLLPSGSGRLLKAATYLGRKWPHLAGREEFWVRLSAGRSGEHRLADLDDEELTVVLLRELGEATGIPVGATSGPPRAVVRRWPAAMPQLTVGHGARVAAVRADLPDGLLLAGAAYDGLGLVAAARSGRAAAAALLEGPTAARRSA